MKNLKAAVQLVLADLKELSIPAVATLVGGLLAPVVATVLGATVTAAEVSGWLLIVGGVAATLEKIASGQAAAKTK